MVHTREKLVEMYLEWRTATFPEWARARGLEAQGITTLDPAIRERRAKEGDELLRQLRLVERKGKVDDQDIDIRLCIDDCGSAISRLRSPCLNVREVIELVAPDPDEAPWIENVRWLDASQEMPRALARAQASGPWVKQTLEAISAELEAFTHSRDQTRCEAAKRARIACDHLANAVGYRPLASSTGAVPKGAWATGMELVTRDRKRLDIALANSMPNLLPEAAISHVIQETNDRGLVLGLAEGWRDTLRSAVERSGWVPVPEHEAPAISIMPNSRAYTSANLRNFHSSVATVSVALPTSGATLPMTLAHETYPGHMLQKVYQARSPSGAMRLLSSSTSDEGWAHYAEMKIHELGIADPRVLEVGLAQRSLLRSTRLLARVGVVTGKMSPSDVFRLFRETALLSPPAALRETSRAQWDHKSVDYSLGRLALEQMEREFVGRGMGDEVTFRIQVLPILSAPLDMVAKRLGLKKPSMT